MVNWISAAWDDLQLERPDWYWLRAGFTLTLSASDYQYSYTDAGIATRFSMWDTNSLRQYKLSKNDEIQLSFMGYEDFRQSYLIGAETQSQPEYFTIDPQLNLMFGPIPDATYTVSGEYFKAPHTLATNEDIPEIPAQYHMAIVYRALMLYARYEAASEIYEDASLNYKRFLRRLELNQLPDVAVGGTLT
jgi:hypothetical protein